MVQILPLLLAVLCSVCFGDNLGWTHLGAAGFQVIDDVLVTTPLSGNLTQLTWGSIKTVGS